jgi:hypothetical protein
LTLPKNLTLLPLFICAISNSYAFSSDKNLRIDQRISTIHNIRTSKVSNLLLSIHPILYSISDLNDINSPKILPLTYSKLKNDSIYLMNTGEILILWIGSEVKENDLINLKEGLDMLNNSITSIKEENEFGYLFVSFIKKVRSKFGFLSIKICKQKSFTEKIFKDKLIEDKNNNSFSYIDFLFFLQNEQSKY